jgi:hypothetical protein
VVAWLLTAQSAFAQREYRNTHSGQPSRVEDALGEQAGHFDIAILGARLDRPDAGRSRWLFSPAVSLGLPARTSVELGASIVWREPGAVPRGGMNGIDAQLSHTFNRETRRAPVIAGAIDAFMPSGSTRSGGVWAQARVMATSTFGALRLHLNSSLGRYDVDLPNPALCTTSRILVKLGLRCDGSLPPSPGGPCLDIASEGVALSVVVAHCGKADAAFVTDTVLVIGPRTVPKSGARWFGGIGTDFDVARWSSLLVMDLYATRLVGIQTRPEWTAEIGLRKQLGSSSVIALGTGRHFAGTRLGWSLTAGVTQSIVMFHGASTH